MIRAEDLASICSQILRKFPYGAVQSVQWLHFTNTREVIQKNVLMLNPAMVVLECLPRIPWLVLNAAKLCLVIVFAKIVMKRRQVVKGTHFDGLIRTWCLGGHKTEDFYFGNLQTLLDAKGINTLMICGSQNFGKWKDFKIHKSQTKTLHEIIFLKPQNVWEMFIQQLYACCKLMLAALCERDKIFKRLLFVVARDCLRIQTLHNGLYFDIGEKIVEAFTPKFVIYSYEGFAWEGNFFNGVKLADHSCKAVGYQHSTVLPRAFDILGSIPGSKEVIMCPDIILCCGKKTATMMRRDKENHSIVFGSFRNSEMASSQPLPGRRTILVVPEGILIESIILFEWAMDVAKSLPGYTVILRCHPALPYDSVRTHLREDPAKYSNIEVSSQAIERDYERASIVVYRGSSSVLYAILQGLKPFNIQDAREDNIDPLFELNHWREVVNSPQDLVTRIVQYSEGGHDENEWKVALDYVSEYTLPVKDESIQSLQRALQL